MPSSQPPTKQPRNLDIGIPGVKQILNPHSNLCKRFLWFIMLAACTAAVVYQLIDRISYYLSEPTSSHVVIKENDSMIFPSVSICPSFYTSILLTLLAAFYLSANETNANRTHQQCPNKQWFGEYVNADKEATPTDMAELWKLIFMEKSGVTVSKAQSYFREFSDESKTLAFNVKETEVPWTKCLTVNVEDQFQIYGETTVTITVPIFELIPMLSNFKECPQQDWFFPEIFELSVAINDFGVPLPHGYDVYEFLRVLPGQKAVYRLNRRQLSYVHTNERPCEGDWLRSYFAYDACVRNEMRSWNITCSTPFTTLSEKPLCANPLSFVNSSMVLIYYLMTNATYKQECSQMQARLCQEKKFNAELRSSTNITANDTLQIDLVIYDKFYESVHEEFTYLFPALLSDIGGSMGIFLGICVLTVMEIFEQIFFELRLRLQKCCNKK